MRPEELEEKKNKRKRIAKIKTFMICLFMFFLIVPSVISVIALIRMERLEKSILETRNMIEDISVRLDNAGIKETASAADPDVSVVKNEVFLSSGEDYGTLSNSRPKTVSKKVYLTFDDGPSSNTERILDILDKYDVKATFFVNGHEKYDEELKKIAEAGHSIGMHSWSHDYSDVYADLDSFADDLDRIHSHILEVTGVDSTYYRFPGGSSNCHTMDVNECISYLDAKDISYFDWNVSAADAVSGTKSAAQIADTVIRGIEKEEGECVIVLMHDAAGRGTTVDALPGIIEAVMSMEGAELLPISGTTEEIHFR